MKKLYKVHGFYAKAGNYYFRERFCIRRDMVEKEKRKKKWKREEKKETSRIKRLWEWFSEYSIGYGEKPWRMLYWIAGIILAFGMVFFFTNCIRSSPNVCTQWKPIKAIYFSAMTFATVGYGDYAPCTWWAQILTIIEAMLGLSTTALFVVSVGRLIIRD